MVAELARVPVHPKTGDFGYPIAAAAELRTGWSIVLQIRSESCYHSCCRPTTGEDNHEAIDYLFCARRLPVHADAVRPV